MENKDKKTKDTGDHKTSALKEKWSNMTGAEKRNILIGGAVVAAVAAVFIADQNSPTKEERDAKKGKSTQIATQIVSPAKKDISREDMMRSLTQQKNRADQLENRLQQLENGDGKKGAALGELDRAANELDDKPKVDVVETKTNTPVGGVGSNTGDGASQNPNNGSTVPPEITGSNISAAEKNAIGGLDIGSDSGTGIGASQVGSSNVPPIDGSGNVSMPSSSGDPAVGMGGTDQTQGSSYWKRGTTGNNKQSSQTTNPSEKKSQSGALYIPSNSIFRVVSVTGLNAPTSEQTQKTPMPVVLRVKQLARLPNQVTADLQDCMIGGVGYGQMSDERVMIRVTNISCMNRHNQALEASIQGTLYGEDGKVGFRGRMVSKTGEIISQMMKVAAWSVPAQMLVGLGSNIEVGKTDRSSHTSVYLNTGKATADAATAAANGVGNIFNEISGIYKQYAQQVFPVIEVNPGRYGTVVITNGFKLKLADQEK